MTDPDHTLSKVEQRLLHELVAYQAQLPGDAPDSRGWKLGHRHARRAQNAAVALALLAAAIFLAVRAISDSATRALAATPQPLAYHSPGPGAPSGRGVLLKLAARAANQTGSGTAGAFEYVKTAGWYLHTRVSGDTATSKLRTTITESWLASDGSGRVLRREVPASAPIGSVGSQGQITDDFQVPAGRPLLKLSANESTLAAQLAIGHPTTEGPAEQWVAVVDLASRQVITPRDESVILRLLATNPALVNSGTVVDRAGRPGVALSLDSSYTGLPTRYTLIFDPQTGSLLDYEETLLGNPGKLDVRPGSVIAYTTFLASGYVNDASSQP